MYSESWIAPQRLALILVLGLGAGCSKAKAPGELVLSFQTNMSVPKDVDAVGIKVLVSGKTQLDDIYQVGPTGLHIPATLGVVAGSDPSAAVTIQVIAYDRGAARILREAITTVPTDRLALLRMPIEWLCDGTAKESANQPDPARKNYDSSCGTGKTCIAGSCVTSQVVASNLPTFAPQQVFGGGDGNGSGTCLDTVACFAKGSGVPVNGTDCTITKPSGGTGINIAIVNPPGTVGICGPDACLVPLDQDPDTGWTEVNGRIKLPSAVCDRLKSGAAAGLAVTTACATKTASVPTCGPWSAVNSTAHFDAGAPANVVLVPDAGHVDASVPVDAGPGVAEAGPPPQHIDAGPVQSCTLTTVTGCDPVAQTGCGLTEVCAVASATQATCVPANPANSTHGQNYPCSDPSGCADGTFCNGVSCGTYCCSASDCVKAGQSGLSCTPVLAFGSKVATFSVCSSGP